MVGHSPRLTSASMTFSNSTAMTFRRVNSGLSKILRMSRSVSRCCTSISSTAAAAMFGLSVCRQSVKKACLGDLLDQPLGQLRHPRLELIDRLLEGSKYVLTRLAFLSILI